MESSKAWGRGSGSKVLDPENRTQYVLYEGYQSVHKTIRCGVPQGSILGPLLFLIYINDLPQIADKTDFILSADDSNVFFTDKSIDVLQQKVNKELEVISNWFKANKLSLNLGKTCSVVTVNQLPNKQWKL